MTIAIITHPDCLLHDTGFEHPECPERLQIVSNELANAGFEFITSYKQATREQLCRVHDERYIDRLFQLAPQQELIYLDPDTVMSPHTLSAALYAAGAVIKGVDLLMSDSQVDAVFCNIRPPGHHAERARAMGFCFFNNLAVGVAHAIEHYHMKRVAIVDFDVHRGNGTEDIFQNNKKILICSIYEQYLYPVDKPITNAKNIINIPLTAGATGREFRAEIIQNGLDKINEFKPEMIFISAGFDGHEKDTISNLNLTEFDYLWITQQIKQLANKYSQGRIVSVLEGGYALDVLGQCVVAHVKGLI